MKEEELLRVIKEGTLDIMGKTLRVYVLEDGRAIINADDFEGIFELDDEDPR